jgi:ATP-binding cassette subfamily C (CFTR/MRP) protein 1
MVTVLLTLATITAATPLFFPACVPLFGIYYYTKTYYIPTARELQRLQSKAKSPVVSHFSETIAGASTIRAYRAQATFRDTAATRLDAYLRAKFYSTTANRWLATRLEATGAVCVAVAALFCILDRDRMSAGVAGLSITYALSVTNSLNWLVRMAGEVETDLVAVERLVKYMTLPNEAKAETDGAARGLIANWPSKGKIELKKLSLRYRPGLPLVLKGLDVTIEGGSRVGVIGRTGAGKSSVLLALLRLVEAEADGGAVEIDGVDTARVGLEDVRGRLSIIPQEPILFSGTVRFNLDPTEKYSDDTCWQALRRAHVADHIQSLDGGLDAEVVDDGGNFSVGQRQLVCLARALLRNSKILLLDEATSAVDQATDKLIQSTIRTEFDGATVLTIAHRLDTIADYDKILVLGDGRVLEFGSPAALLEDEDGFFTQMLEAERQGMTG